MLATQVDAHVHQFRRSDRGSGGTTITFLNRRGGRHGRNYVPYAPSRTKFSDICHFRTNRAVLNQQKRHRPVPGDCRGHSSEPLSSEVHTPDATPRPPVILIVSEQEWLARTVDTLVAEQGMVSVRAYTGREALSLGMDGVADVVVADSRLPDIAGVDLARALQATSDLGTALPIMLITTDDPDRQAMLEALEAGVWEYLAFPFDGASFSARLSTFSSAKRRADRFRDESLVDQPTGVYSLRGITRRARELGAGVQRLRTPIGCVAVAADVERDGAPSDPPVADAALFADLLRSTARASDVVGRTGPGEFAVFTPGAGPDGTAAYVARLQRAIDATPRGGGQRWRLRAAWCASDMQTDATPDPVDMMQRVGAELRLLRDSRDQASRLREVPLPHQSPAAFTTAARGDEDDGSALT